MDTLSEQLDIIKAHRAAARRKRYRPSRLDRHRADIEQLAAAGASWADIALWLRKYRRVKVNRTTVGRALKRWSK